MKRPLALMCFCYITAQTVAVYLPLAASIVIGAVFAAAFLFLLISKKRKERIKEITVCATVSAALIVSSLYSAVVFTMAARIDGTGGDCIYTVCESSPTEFGNSTLYTVKVESAEGEDKSFFTKFFSEKELLEGYKYKSCLEFYRRSNDAAGDKSRKVFVYAKSDDIVECVGKSSSPVMALRRLRGAASDIISEYIDAPADSVISAIALGDKTKLSPQTKHFYRTSGLSHILVVSGFHLTMLAQLVYWVLRLFRVPRKMRAAMSICAVIFYTVFSGVTASVVRAAIMTVMVFSTYFSERQPDSVTSLGFAGFLLCALNPFAPGDLGFILSFASTFAIITGMERYEDIAQTMKVNRGLMRRISIALYVPMLAFAAVFAPSVIFLGSVSLVSVPSNIVASVLFMPMYAFGLLTVIFGACSLEFFAGAAAWVAEFCAKLITGYAEFTSTLKFSVIPLKRGYMIISIISAVITAALCLLLEQKKRIYLRAIAAAMVCIAVGAASSALLSINCTRIYIVTSSDTAAVAFEKGRTVDIVFIGENTDCADELSSIMFDAGCLRPRKICFFGSDSTYAALRENFPEGEIAATLQAEYAIIKYTEFSGGKVLSASRGDKATAIIESDGITASVSSGNVIRLPEALESYDISVGIDMADIPEGKIRIYCEAGRVTVSSDGETRMYENAAVITVRGNGNYTVSGMTIWER